MSSSQTPSPDNELLLILLRNLRNAAATFGEGTPPHESIRTTLEEHVQTMRRKGIPTDLTQTREMQALGLSHQQPNPQPARHSHLSTPPPPRQEREEAAFVGNLALRPKKAAPSGP